MKGYIYYHHDNINVQKTVVNVNGSEREVFWRGGLSLTEARNLVSDCDIVDVAKDIPTDEGH